MVDAFIASLPMVTPPGTAQVYNNCGYYLLGRIVGKVRGTPTPMAAIQQHLCAPLQITRIRQARSLVADQLPDEARYGGTTVGEGPDVRLDVPVIRTVMSNDRPLVPRGYGRAVGKQGRLRRIVRRSDRPGAADRGVDQPERYAGAQTRDA